MNIVYSVTMAEWVARIKSRSTTTLPEPDPVGSLIGKTSLASYVPVALGAATQIFRSTNIKRRRRGHTIFGQLFQVLVCDQ
jgi:hypothetical protein